MTTLDTEGTYTGHPLVAQYDPSQKATINTSSSFSMQEKPAYARSVTIHHACVVNLTSLGTGFLCTVTAELSTAEETTRSHLVLKVLVLSCSLQCHSPLAH